MESGVDTILESTTYALTSRQRFLAACSCKPLQRPPVWLMRQAGRCLPEYRALKQQYSFNDLVRIPELAAAITLQPVQRFGFDAAIIFSDILVVAEAMGQSYRYVEGLGINMDWKLEYPGQISNLVVDSVEENLNYVCNAITLVRNQLASQKALIGFAGSPWTLVNFMLEGGSSKTFERAWSIYLTEPLVYRSLAEKVAEATIRYLRLQVSAGVDAIQIFDTLAGLIPSDQYMDASGKWINYILSSLRPSTTCIVFPKGIHYMPSQLSFLEADVLGVDASVSLRELADQLPADVAVQGNLNPDLLLSTPQDVASATQCLIRSMRGRPGHIVNLGHGVPPNAKIECIEALVQTIMEQ